MHFFTGMPEAVMSTGSMGCGRCTVWLHSWEAPLGANGTDPFSMSWHLTCPPWLWQGPRPPSNMPPSALPVVIAASLVELRGRGWGECHPHWNPESELLHLQLGHRWHGHSGHDIEGQKPVNLRHGYHIRVCPNKLFREATLASAQQVSQSRSCDSSQSCLIWARKVSNTSVTSIDVVSLSVTDRRQQMQMVYWQNWSTS